MKKIILIMLIFFISLNIFCENFIKDDFENLKGKIFCIYLKNGENYSKFRSLKLIEIESKYLIFINPDKNIKVYILIDQIITFEIY